MIISYIFRGDRNDVRTGWSRHGSCFDKAQ